MLLQWPGFSLSFLGRKAPDVEGDEIQGKNPVGVCVAKEAIVVEVMVLRATVQ
jgi:hypothetical protein